MLRKVFLVEDETVIREGLRDRIPWDQFGYRFVGEAAEEGAGCMLFIRLPRLLKKSTKNWKNLLTNQRLNDIV